MNYKQHNTSKRNAVVREESEEIEENKTHRQRNKINC